MIKISAPNIYITSGGGKLKLKPKIRKALDNLIKVLKEEGN